MVATIPVNHDDGFGLGLPGLIGPVVSRTSLQLNLVSPSATERKLREFDG
jgi:hypothetical protein